MEMYHSTPTSEPPNPWKVDFPEHYVNGYANNWNRIFLIYLFIYLYLFFISIYFLFWSFFIYSFFFYCNILETWTYRRSYSHSSQIEPNDVTLQVSPLLLFFSFLLFSSLLFSSLLFSSLLFSSLLFSFPLFSSLLL